MSPEQLVELINQYGFPIVAAVGMGYFVYFIYQFVTTKLTPIISETSVILIALIDRVRMLDNDLLRLQQKVSVILQMKEDQYLQTLRDSHTTQEDQGDDEVED